MGNPWKTMRELVGKKWESMENGKKSGGTWWEIYGKYWEMIGKWDENGWSMERLENCEETLGSIGGNLWKLEKNVSVGFCWK